MPWYMRFLLDKDPDSTAPATPPAPDSVSKADFDELKSFNAKLIERLDALEGKGKDKDKDEDDLHSKAKKEKEESDRKKGELADLESSIAFTLSAKTFVEAHEEYLPEDAAEIIKHAEKETFDSAVEKAGAIKANLVKSFFSVQANLDLLTAGQKKQIDNFLALSKNGREEKAAEVYSNVFEPSIETLKKIRKAQEVGKSRTTGTKHENAYKDKLVTLSRETYLRNKGK